MARASRSAGFTLIELAIVLAVAGLLAAVAWPSLQSHLMKARRADATAALQQVALAQARHHAAHGLYTDNPRELGAAAGSSDQGLYRIAVVVGPGEVFTAVAQARQDRSQARDTDCTEITLRVEQGFAQRGPSAACWTR